MKNTNKGFTLIELLAVIVILAVIALITTPVVLGVIGKAKLKVVEISGLNYVDAIENEIMLDMMESDEEIEDGVYDYDEILVSIKGQAPNSGWFKIEEGQVSDYSFVIDGHVVTKGSKIKKGDTAATKPRDGVYILGELIYFDPVSDDKCDENSESETCYKWRVIETADIKSKPTITLQMDHNLINMIAWAPRNSATGPVTALEELNIKTEAWTRVEPLTYEYDTSAAENNYGKMSCTNGNCTLNGNSVEGTARARMITGEEVRDITNTEVIDLNANSKTWTLASPSANWFYFSRTDKKIGTKEGGTGNKNLAWIVENTSKVAESGATSKGQENYGYWTLSPISDNPYYAWDVNRYGTMNTYNVNNANNYGVRPVITVLKSNI